MTVTPLFSLADLIGSELIQQYLGDGLDSVLDRIVIQNIQKSSSGAYSAYVAVKTSDLSPLPLIGDSILLDLSKDPGGIRPPALPTDSEDGLLSIGTVAVTISPSFSISITMGVGLMFSADLLTPQDGSDAVSIAFGLTLTVDSTGVQVGPASLTLPACGIGSTGLNITGGTIILALWGSGGDPALTALGVDSNFRGVALQSVGVSLPSDLEDSSGALSGKLVFTSATIGNTGFSGKLTATFSPGLDLTFLGADLNITGVSLQISQNAFAGGGISGTLTLPFFDEPVAVSIAPAQGGWGVSLTGGLVDLTIDGVLELELTSLGVQQTDGDIWFKISGTLTPQITIGSIVTPSDWPSLTLKDVLIDKSGHIKASGGKLALSSQQTLSLGNVFKAKLTHFSFGSSTAGVQFISLSGEVDLLAGVSLVAKFDDMRIGWDGSFSLKGLEIDCSEAGVFIIDGAVDFIYPDPSSGSGGSALQVSGAGLSEHGFQGSIKLGITSAGFEIDASMSVLEVTDTDQNGNVIHYTALFVDLGVQIPGGIPLFSTGLAIQGMEGLIGWNYGPNVEDQYSGNWFNWYLGNSSGNITPATIGATPLVVGGVTKWEPQYNTKAFGVGVSLGTLPDVGFTWHSSIIFVIVLPGPDLILSGTCNFISKPAGLDDASSYSGAFSVLIVYDGTAETLQANIAANVNVDPILTATGSACAFFDFNNPSAWYFDVGTQAKPLQASVLKIFTATAYFDLDNQELDFGTNAGFKASYSLGPLSAAASLTTGLTAVVVYRPAHLAATAQLNGSLNLSAFGVGANVSVNASAALDLRAATSNASATFNVQAEIEAELSINLIFTHVNVGGTIELDVSSGDYAAPNPPAYPLNSITIQHALVQNTWPLPLSPPPTVDGMAGGQPSPTSSMGSLPIVPPDGLPTITFSVPMNDATGVNQNIPTNGYTAYGNAQYQYTLQSITIEQLDGNGNSLSPAVFVSGVAGKWSALNGTYTLQIWADTPGSASSLSMTLPNNRLADQQAILGPTPCAPISYVPTTVCAPMSDSAEVQLGYSYAAVPPGATFDGITLDDSWKAAQDQSSGTRVVWMCPQGSLRFSEPVGVITVRGGTFYLSGSDDPDKKPALAEIFCAANARSGGSSSSGSGATGPFALLDSNNSPVSFTQTAGSSSYTLNCPQGAWVLRALEGIAISEVCYVTLEELQEQQAAAAANSAKQSALQKGASAAASSNPTLLPWTQYRITVTTQVAGQQNGQPITSIPSVTGSTFTDQANFTTGGPPGFPDQPGAVADTSAGNPLADLTRYLTATVPLGDTGRLASGRYESAYCGYDLAMYFNEPYVPTLYINANTTLQLNAIDLNSVTLAQNGVFDDKTGQPILGSSFKGSTGSVEAKTALTTVPAHASPLRTLWASQLARCGVQQQYPADSGVTLPMSQQSRLSPRSRYKIVATAMSSLEAASDSATVVASADVTTSRFLTMTHHLQSFPDTVFTLQAADATEFSGVAASMSTIPSAVSAEEVSLFNTLWTAGLGSPQVPPVETLDVSAVLDSLGTVIALLFVSPEPVPWDRVSWSAHLASSVVQAQRPTTAKINDLYDGGPSYIDVMLLEDSDPVGWQLVARTPAQDTTPAEETLLYTFGESGEFPAGTLLRIFYAGSSSASQDILTDTTTVGMPSGTTSITLLDASSSTLHTRALIDESVYSQGGLTLGLVRNADGTLFALFNTAGGTSVPFPNAGGDLRLAITALRDVGDPTRMWSRCGDSTEEGTNLHVAVPTGRRIIRR